MSFESAVSFFIVILVFGMTPGPGVFAILARALKDGIKPCVMLALGMTVSDILYLIAACLGLAALAEQWSELFQWVRYIGGSYLLYLSWQMWHADTQQHATGHPSAEMETKQVHGDGIVAESWRFDFLQGFIISITNPKVILFYMAFLPTFIDLTQLTYVDIVVAAVLTLFALMMGLLLIAGFASKAKSWIQSQQGATRLNRTAAIIMGIAGAYLFVSA